MLQLLHHRRIPCQLPRRLAPLVVQAPLQLLGLRDVHAALHGPVALFVEDGVQHPGNRIGPTGLKVGKDVI